MGNKKKQINATISPENKEYIDKLAIKEKRTFSNMLDVVIDKQRELDEN